MSDGHNERENWGSRIGFILAASGSAIGLGNIWRFPYMVGMNGGAAFLVVYLLLVATIGATVMLGEFALGRRMRKAPVPAFWQASGTHTWTLVGWMGTIGGSFIILSYYAVIGGWTLKYIVASLQDLMPQAVEGRSGDVFNHFVGSPTEVIAYFLAFMAMTVGIVLGGIGKGIERACKVMMPLLFLIMLVLIARAVTLPGALQGLDFYLRPDFSKLTWPALLDALSQGFFSLSLGMGIMVTYASYIRDEEHLPSSVAYVVFYDSLAAFLAGLVIFPAVFSMGLEPTQGVGLTFIVLPGVFARMPHGEIFSALFFVLLFFAAITSSMSLFEVTVAHGMDDLKWSRRKSSLVMGVIITLLGLPSAASLSGSPKLWGMDFLSAMDFLSNHIILPLCAILTCIFVGWRFLDRAEDEISNHGTYRFKLLRAWAWIIRIVAPVAIGIVFYKGLF